MASTSVTTYTPAGLWCLCAPSRGMLVSDESFNVFSVFTVTLQTGAHSVFTVWVVWQDHTFIYNIINSAPPSTWAWVCLCGRSYYYFQYACWPQVYICELIFEGSIVFNLCRCINKVVKVLSAPGLPLIWWMSGKFQTCQVPSKLLRGPGAVFLVPKAVKLLHHSISPLSWFYRDSSNGGDFMGGEDPRWGGWMIIGFVDLIIYIITQFAFVFW